MDTEITALRTIAERLAAIAHDPLLADWSFAVRERSVAAEFQRLQGENSRPFTKEHTKKLEAYCEFLGVILGWRDEDVAQPGTYYVCKSYEGLLEDEELEPYEPSDHRKYPLVDVQTAREMGMI